MDYPRQRGRKSGSSTLLVECPHEGDDGYDISTGIDIDEDDFEPMVPLRCIRIVGGEADASGFIDVQYEGGGRQVIPAKVSAGDHRDILVGNSITKIYNKDTGNTTFDGYIFPLF